jgi:AAA ATPase domain
MSNYGPPGEHDVIGREKEVAAILASLTSGTSLSITGERRIGKSWTLREVERTAPKNWVVVYRDVEHLTTLEAFESSLVEALEEKQWGITKKIKRIRQNTSAVSAMDIRLELTDASGSQSIQHLIEGVSRKKTVVLLLDELPFFAEHLEKARAGAALELMALLRSLRQNNVNLRIVIAGSVGFHHLLANSADLNASTNDLALFAITALHPDAARSLAVKRLKEIGCVDVANDLVDLVCLATDNVAFYVNHLVDDIDLKNRPTITAELISSIRQHALTSALDPWKLTHYRDRLTKYYESDAPLAEAILRIVARSSLPLTSEAIANSLQSVPALQPPIADQKITSTLNRLELDHYLVMSSTSTTSTYSFVLTLVRDLFVNAEQQ